MRAKKILEEASRNLAEQCVHLELDEFDTKQLRRSAPAVFVCNQLTPGIDEWILLYLMAQNAESGKVLHPYPTPLPNELLPFVIRPMRRKWEDRLLRVNFAKKVARYVEKGISVGVVVDFSENPLSDLPRNLLRPQVLRQLRKIGAPIIPVHLKAETKQRNNLLQLLFGRLSRPSVAERPLFVQVRIGLPIQPEDIARLKSQHAWGGFLQAKIFSLGTDLDLHSEPEYAGGRTTRQPISEPTDAELVRREIAALPAECLLTSRSHFDVYLVPFSAIPNTMFEIGRLREMTFRAVGEGTGKARDLDEYDLYYLQLIIWDRTASRIVGGYRLGQGDRILRQFGIKGFYVNSLFKIKPEFYPILEKAVELGRSYVVPEYQRHRLPLFLLWKGILHFLLANPQYRYLYGPVSISKQFSEASKAVIVEFLKRFCYDEELARFIRPRKPFRVRIKSVNTRLLAETLQGEFDALENLIEAMEPAHFKVPVLFRQYLRQNARFIGFNIDPLFADCLDGLMILDLHNLPSSTLEALQQEKE
ncbi:MAG: lysophospholipid acyltransferase family protein [Saprospiraceae bacterium]|nr:lysophospholipid acyltransferase family protein [Saprospiraceae bacterium]MDW8482779.1 GNAT family N-acyltransferase [Saprospiraceae bacterium]